jgi:serine/threonine protein kinase/tetratricopeptide (TPR) repeat protein
MVAWPGGLMDDADATRSQPPVIATGSATTSRRPIDEPVALDDTFVEEPETYAVESQIGAGGMGVVLAARGLRLGRPVAIKVVTIDRDDLRLRFERETRITARLQHPAIVPVYGAGRASGGRPFYAMKHVSGEPLDQVIARATTLEQRIGLLPSVIAVTEAIAYAHAERVIHRDLKPANILVGAFGETVVIDWGLAKDLAAPDVEASDAPASRESSADHTAHGKVMGTPAYMPLEQARGEPVDPRADVYALGAILYHVLSGTAPYRTADEGSVPWESLLARVLTRPPPPLEEVQDGIPADLLAIVARAMAREPDQRYPSAGELAADLERFQTGQLVGAHRYSTWQLVRRWVRRHRATVTVAAVLITVLVAVSVIGIQRIRRERSEAEEARALADEHRVLAVASRNEAEDLMGFMLGDLKDRLKPVGKLDILASVAAKTMAYYRHQPEDASEADRRKHAQALFNVAEVFVLQGNLDGAVEALRASRELRTPLAAAPTAHADQLDLAITHYKLGDVLDTRGDVTGARAEYRAGLALAERAAAGQLGAHEPLFQISRGHNNLADLELAQGDATRAFDGLRRSQQITDRLVAAEPDQPRWLRARAIAGLKLAQALAAKGELAEALTAAREANALFEQITTRTPDNMDARVDLATARTRVGDLLQRQGQITDALAEYRAALAIAEQTARHDPANTEWQRNLVVAHAAIGDALVNSDDAKGAVAEFRAARAVAEALVARDPANAQWRHDLMLMHHRVAKQLGMSGDHAGALADAAKARALIAQLQKADPGNLSYREDEAALHELVGNIHFYRQTREGVTASIPEFEAAIAVFEKLVAGQPTNRSFQRKLAIVYDDLATSYGSLDDPRAIELFAKVLAIYQELLRADPSDLSTLADELVVHVNLYELGTKLRRGDPQAELRAARAIADRLLAAAPDNPLFQAYAAEVAKREAASRKGTR